jgi:sucrose-6-phosphate hydrolase SacC (GH32 family)
MPNFFAPAGWSFADFSLIVHNDWLYAVFLKKVPYKKGEEERRQPNRFGLARSADGVNWEDQGDILLPAENSWDQTMWAGTICRQYGEFVLYYTAVRSKERESSQKIGKAYSQDFKHWQKDSANPLLVIGEDNPYYSIESPLCFRDPFPCDYQGKRYILFAGKDRGQAAGKRGCVGIVEETRKNNFQWRPPIFSPGKYFDGLECPALYNLNSRWYLFYGVDVESGEKSVFHYAMADSPLGPYVEASNNPLLPEDHYVYRIVEFQGRFLLYYWLRDYSDGLIRERLAPPREVKFSDRGEIGLAD